MYISYLNCLNKFVIIKINLSLKIESKKNWLNYITDDDCSNKSTTLAAIRNEIKTGFKYGNYLTPDGRLETSVTHILWNLIFVRNRNYRVCNVSWVRFTAKNRCHNWEWQLAMKNRKDEDLKSLLQALKKLVVNKTMI